MLVVSFFSSSIYHLQLTDICIFLMNCLFGRCSDIVKLKEKRSMITLAQTLAQVSSQFLIADLSILSFIRT